MSNAKVDCEVLADLSTSVMFAIGQYIQIVSQALVAITRIKALKMASASASPATNSGSPAPASLKKGKYSGRGARDRYREDLANRDEAKLPQKRFFRQRAHANPFSDHQLD